MKFRPCIDIHNGVVKQIVGSTLTEGDSDVPLENFVATLSAPDYALLVETFCCGNFSLCLLLLLM